MLLRLLLRNASDVMQTAKILAVICILAGCSQGDTPTTVPRSALAPEAEPDANTTLLRSGRIVGILPSFFGGSMAVETLKSAESVKAFRISTLLCYSHEPLATNEMKSDPVDVADSSSSTLRMILFDPTTYGSAFLKQGIPEYIVRIRFQREIDEVDVLLSFDFDSLRIYHNRKPVSEEYFDNARPRLVALVKDLFPGDKVIQSLEPVR